MRHISRFVLGASALMLCGLSYAGSQSATVMQLHGINTGPTNFCTTSGGYEGGFTIPACSQRLIQQVSAPSSNGSLQTIYFNDHVGINAGQTLLYNVKQFAQGKTPVSISGYTTNNGGYNCGTGVQYTVLAQGAGGFSQTLTNAAYLGGANINAGPDGGSGMTNVNSFTVPLPTTVGASSPVELQLTGTNCNSSDIYFTGVQVQ